MYLPPYMVRILCWPHLAKKMAEEKLLLVTLDESEREKILEKLIEKNVITAEEVDKIEQENLEWKI